MTISQSELKLICPNADDAVLKLLVDPLNRYMESFQINTYPRIRHFIAQIAHETQCFLHFHELYDPPKEVYFAKYDGRMGNNEPGDGLKYCGRGCIHLTGKGMYERASLMLFGDRRLVDNPELVETPELAAMTSCWFWSDNHLNSLADADQIKAITLRINGGLNGLESRMNYYQKCLKFIL